MPTNEEFQTCPFCKEQIRHAALKCRFCGEWVKDVQSGSTDNDADAESLRQDARYEIKAFRTELDYREQTIKQIDSKVFPTVASDMEDTLSNLGKDWPARLKDEFARDLDNLRQRVGKFSDAYRRATVKREKDRVTAVAKDIRAAIANEAITSEEHLEKLTDFAGRFGSAWDENLKNKFSEEFVSLRQELNSLHTEALETLHRSAIRETLAGNIGSLKSIVPLSKRLKAGKQYFQSRKLLSAKLASEFQSALERLAWYRAEKLLADAEVAEGGGNFKKAAKLRAQAKVVLRQDWEKTFVDGPKLNLDTLPQFQS